jgi:hypothetical protein
MKWNKSVSGILVAVALCMYSTPVLAYQAMTHAAITNHVASRTILSNKELMAGMGFDVIHSFTVDELLWTNGKGDSECNTSARDRNIEHFYCGAAIEDWGSRTYNHYFDPRRNLALYPVDSPPIPFDVEKNPDWALEDEIDISGQDFSLKDAYDHFLLSKTSMLPEQRKRREQQLFLTLGRVLHNLQDMAQPADVRNDFHSDHETLWGNASIPFLPDTDYYERNTESLWKELPLAGYPDLDLNDFRKARDFWLTDYSLSHGQWQGKGLAEFSNWNFVSKNSNFAAITIGNRTPFGPQIPLFPNDNYDHPKPEDVTSIDIELSRPDGSAFFKLKGYVGNTVKDIYQWEESYNEKAAVFSILAPAIYSRPGVPIAWKSSLTLDDDCYEAARQYLIPRAVAYSAGLVNYFFRGQMAVDNVNILGAYPTERDTYISFTMTNVSSDHTPGNAPFHFENGAFNLYYERKNGSRRGAQPFSGSEAVELSGQEKLYDQESKALQYVITTLDWDRSKPLTLVYDGIIGDERGIAVKKIYPDPLLAFTVEGVTGDSPVENTVNVYASYDMGTTWELNGGFALDVGDSTLTEHNRVLVNDAINLGEGDILAHASYKDYMDADGNLLEGSAAGAMMRSKDYGKTWSKVDFEWQPLMDGAENGADTDAVMEGIVYTGLDGLAGVRIQHMGMGEPRAFQLFKSHDLGAEGSWFGRPGLGTGGLPEVHYLGQNRFGFSSYLEGYHAGPGNEGGDFLFDSIMMRTDDGGENYYQLTDFATECGDPSDPSNKVTYCIQHFEYLGKGPLGFDRLLGWTHLRAESLGDYPNRVPFHLSTDGGTSWSHAMDAPFDQACQTLPVWEGQVEALIYVGKSSLDEDVLMALTQCQEAYEYGPVSEPDVEYGEVVGTSLFYSRNGGGDWLKVNLPPAYNRETVLLYTGDNGAIPALYTR